jgi:hypothetical protein
MKKVWCGLTLLLAVAMTTPASSIGQVPPGLMTPPEVRVTEQGSPPNVGASLAAALSNIVYFPLRFTITVVTAEVGGLTGWLTGGDPSAADAVWQVTEGQGYITPEMIEGRERLRFGQ